MSKLKVYSSKKIILTNKEKKYESKLQKEREKFERDSKCGGIDGSGYVRLHDRYNK